VPSSCAHASWAFPFERVELCGAHAQIVTAEMEQVAYASGLGQAIVQHDFFQLAMPDKWGYREEDTLAVANRGLLRCSRKKEVYP
jgi:hypothetical protein